MNPAASILALLAARRPARRSTRIGHAVLATACAAVLAATGCSSDRLDPRGASEKIYADAKSDMGNGNWEAAIKGLEKVEGQAAGTLLASQASLDLAYAQWKSGERVQAMATIDRFLKLHPSSPAFDYALYLKGLINFNDSMGFLGSVARQDLSERDQQASRDAYQAFEQLMEQFPDSKYSEDARARMGYIVNALASHEVHVARYYFRRAAYLAAANRAQTAVKEFTHSPATEEALYIMVASYDKLGLTQLRDDAERVLKQNFPDSRFFRSGIGRAEQRWWQFW